MTVAVAGHYIDITTPRQGREDKSAAIQGPFYEHGLALIPK